MIAIFAVTASGRRAAAEVAAALGPDATVVDEPVGSALPELWPGLSGAVFFLATGATVRLVAPLLADKHSDPGVVCVDEARRFVVALCGGHDGGANELADRVARLLGATPVITTAADSVGATPLDELVDLLHARVDGDLAAAGVAVLDGSPVRLDNPLRFPLPPLPGNLAADIADPAYRIVVDDRVTAASNKTGDGRTLHLVPPTLVVGVGSERGVSERAVADTIQRLRTEHGLDLGAVRAYASLDRKVDELGILAAIAPARLRCYPAEALAGVEVPNPSERVRAEVGTPSVAEAAALHAADELAGGAPVELAVPKIKGAGVTVAAARIRPRGRLALVGLGPGADDQRTPRADAELRRASVVVGLDRYVE